MGQPITAISDRTDVLAFFFVESDRRMIQMLRDCFDGEWQIAFVSEVGQAARLVRMHRPNVLLVCARIQEMEIVAPIMTAVGKRLSRGQALVALTVKHDQQLERAVRIAGATHYFALENQEELEAMGQIVCAGAVTARCGPAPPRVLRDRMFLD